MSVNDQIDTFILITGSNDPQLAKNFLEMANQNLETAISLYFEHGAQVVSTNSNDQLLAQETLQQSYKEDDNVRVPDQPIHERLVRQDFNATTNNTTQPFDPFGFFENQPRNQFGGSDNMFGGGGRSGAFNKNYSNEHPLVLDDTDDDDSEELDGQDNIASIKFSSDSHDIINSFDFDTAKAKARRAKKWILINIQDDNLQSKALDRDFWSSLTVRGLIRRNFVFIQYHKDSRSGGLYSQFYEIKGIPHIAIIDPITGEQLKTWNEVPIVRKWNREVENFLNSFSLEIGAINPVKSDRKSLEQEKQLKPSFIQNTLQNQPTVDLSHSGDIDDPIEIDEYQYDSTQSISIPKETKILTEEEKIKAIEPLEVPEPTGDASFITRVQIRTGEGKRVVRKFNTEDKVLIIYQYVKHTFEEANKGTWFILSSQRENLFTKLNQRIGEAGLKNASILLEYVEDEETSKA